jgi:hypothetical protein
MTRFTSSDLALMERRISGRPKFVIGIDPGRTTGYAFISQGTLVSCESDIPIKVEERVLKVFAAAGQDLFVVVEDSRHLRLPKHLQSSSARDKGVGGVWAEMVRWQDFMEHHGIPHKMQSPSKSIKRKTTQEEFKKDFPDFKGRTNHNARDAAYLAKHFG